MKTFLKGVVSFLTAISLMGIICTRIYAASEPDFYSEYYNSGNIFASIGYYGQCTWYAYGRACELNDTTYPFKWDAAKWYYYAKDSGDFEIGSEPKANSIAVWQFLGSGHVAYVESVDGDVVTISESNNNHAINYKSYSLQTGIGQYDGVKTFSSSEMVSRYSRGTFLGYIYLGELSSIVDETVVEPVNDENTKDNTEISLTTIIYSNNDYYSKYQLEDELLTNINDVIMDY